MSLTLLATTSRRQLRLLTEISSHRHPGRPVGTCRSAVFRTIQDRPKDRLTLPWQALRCGKAPVRAVAGSYYDRPRRTVGTGGELQHEATGIYHRSWWSGGMAGRGARAAACIPDRVLGKWRAGFLRDLCGCFQARNA